MVFLPFPFSIDFEKCLHSVGVPLKDNSKDSEWPCNVDNHHLAFFPDDEGDGEDSSLGNPRFVSFGSLYGGCSMLAQKWFGLDWGSVLAKREGWMAEHCAVLTVTGPNHHKYHLAAILPSGCGKSSLALHLPSIPGTEQYSYSVLRSFFILTCAQQVGLSDACLKTLHGYEREVMDDSMPSTLNMDSLELLLALRNPIILPFLWP